MKYIKNILEAIQTGVKKFTDKNIAGENIVKPIVAIGALIAVFFILTATINGIVKIITENMAVASIAIVAIIWLINKIYSKQEKTDMIVPNQKMIDYNYRIIRSKLFQIIPDLAVSLGLTVPTLPSKLNAPVRYKFIGKTCVYNYLLIINSDDGEVNVDLVEENLQRQIEILLEEGKFDSIEAPILLVNGVGYPRVMVHDIQITQNMLELSIVYANKAYVEEDDDI